MHSIATKANSFVNQDARILYGSKSPDRLSTIKTSDYANLNFHETQFDLTQSNLIIKRL
jgi:hypothetical protein